MRELPIECIEFLLELGKYIGNKKILSKDNWEYSKEQQELVRFASQRIDPITLPSSHLLKSVIDIFTKYLVLEFDELHIKPIYLKWDNNNGISPLNHEQQRQQRLHDIDYYTKRKTEKYFLNHVLSVHQTLELEKGSLIIWGDFAQIIELLRDLSCDQCFRHKPVYSHTFNSFITPWIQSLPIFTITQFLAATLEVELYHIYSASSNCSRIPTVRFNTDHANNIDIDQQQYPYNNHQNTKTISIMKQGIYLMKEKEQYIQKCVINGLKQVVLDDDKEKVKCIVRVSQKRMPDEVFCRVTSKYAIEIHRLWTLLYIISQPQQPPYCSSMNLTSSSSSHNISKHQLCATSGSAPTTPMIISGYPYPTHNLHSFIVNIVGSPITQLMSPIQELKYSIYKSVYSFASAEYCIHELNLAENRKQLPPKSSKKKSKKRKPKSIGNSKSQIDHSGNSAMMMTTEDSMTTTHAIDTNNTTNNSDDLLEICKPASRVTIKELVATQEWILVAQLVEECVDFALENIAVKIVQSTPSTSLLTSSPDLAVLDSAAAHAVEHAIPDTSTLDALPLEIFTEDEDEDDIITELLDEALLPPIINIKEEEVHAQQSTPMTPMTPMPLRYYDDGDMLSYEYSPGRSASAPFDADFALYSMWSRSNHVYAGLEEQPPAGVLYTEWESDSSRHFELPLDLDDDEEAGEAYAPLTTAVLRAHTVYHESQQGTEADNNTENYSKINNNNRPWVFPNKSEGLFTNKSSQRYKVRSAFAPSVGNNKKLSRDMGHLFAADKRPRGELGEEEEAERADCFSLDTRTNEHNPVYLILSSRLLRSEGLRAASLNQHSLLAQVVSSMMQANNYGFWSQQQRILQGRALEVMSEDGTKTNTVQQQHHQQQQQQQQQQLQMNNNSTRLHTAHHNNVSSGGERHARRSLRSGMSLSSAGARSISSLPNKHMPSSQQQQQQLQQGQRQLLQLTQSQVASLDSRPLETADHHGTAVWSGVTVEAVPLPEQQQQRSRRALSIEVAHMRADLLPPPHGSPHLTLTLTSQQYIPPQPYVPLSPRPAVLKAGEETGTVVSDNMHLSDDDDLLLSSLLTREVLDWVGSMDLLDSALRRLKDQAIVHLRGVVRNLWPRAQIKPFGSFVSGLSLPTSDLDLVICMPKVHQESAPLASGTLEGRNSVKESWQQNLARGLRSELWVDPQSIKIIRNTPVPVVKFQTVSKDGLPSVSLDISFESASHRGLASNKLVASLMQTYSHLRPLVLVLKAFLTKKCLCEAFTGGLSSYSLLLLITRFLQEIEPSDISDVGAVLLGLLKFLGEDFDPRYTGVSIARKCYFPRAYSSVTSTQYQGNMAFIPFKFDPLFIEDPLTQGNNVGRNCFRILQVQRTFSEAYQNIVNVLKLSEREGIAYPLLKLLVV